MEKASRKKVGFFSKIGFKMVLIIALAGALICYNVNDCSTQYQTD